MEKAIVLSGIKEGLSEIKTHLPSLVIDVKKEKITEFVSSEEIKDVYVKHTQDIKKEKEEEIKKITAHKTHLKTLKEKYSFEKSNVQTNTAPTDNEKEAQISFILAYEELEALKKKFNDKGDVLKNKSADAKATATTEKVKTTTVSEVKNFSSGKTNSNIAQANFFEELLKDFWEGKEPNFSLKKEFIDKKVYAVFEVSTGTMDEAFFKGKGKNYQCKYKEQIDLYCEIYNLKTTSFGDGSDNEKIKVTDVFKVEHLVKATEAKTTTESSSSEKKNYVIRTSAQKYNFSTGNDSISVVGKGESSATTSIKKKVILPPISETFISKTAILKVVSPISSFSKDEIYQCKWDKNDEDCKLEKIETAVNVEDFKTFKLETSTVSTQKADEYYLVTFENKAFKIEDLKGKLIKLQKDSEDKGSASFRKLVLKGEKNLIFVEEEIEEFLVELKNKESDISAVNELVMDGVNKYKCTVQNSSPQVVDTNCELLDLNYNTKGVSTVKDAINWGKTIQKKEQLEKEKLFKLRIKKDSEVKNGAKFSLASKISGSKYGDFEIKFKFEDSKIMGKTNLLYGKIKGESNEKLANNIKKCKITGEWEDCGIYRLPKSNSSDNSELKIVNVNVQELLSQGERNKGSESGEPTAFFVLDLKDQIYDATTKPEICVSQDGSKSLGAFEISSHLFGFIKTSQLNTPNQNNRVIATK